MKRFQTSGFVTLWLRISVSTLVIKMLAKEIAILVPIASSSMCLLIIPSFEFKKVSLLD